MVKRSPQPLLPEYDKVCVGRRFKTLRKTRGMTLTEWSNAIGLRCSPQKICNYEQGEDQVPVQYAARACILTGASFDYIYRGILSGLSNDLVKRITAAENDPSPERRHHR